MKARARSAVCIGAVLVLLLQGCAGMTPEGQEQVLGGAGGAGLAGLICGVAGGDPGVCVAAAAAGALVGWGATKVIQARQDRTAESEYERYGYTPERGRVVIIRDVKVTPATVTPGSEVSIETDYTLMMPAGSPQKPVTQTFSLWKDGAELHTFSPVELPKEPGGWVVAQGIPVPDDAEPGTYYVNQILDANTRAPEVRRSAFKDQKYSSSAAPRPARGRRTALHRARARPSGARGACGG